MQPGLDNTVPIVDLEINGTKISCHKYVQEFEIVRSIAASCWEGHIIMYDPDWELVEAVVLAGGFQSPIKVYYGWVNDCSPAIVAKIIKYKPNFQSVGVTLEIEFTFGHYEKLVQRRHSVFNGMKISDIVKELCRREGITDYEIEDTNIVLDRHFVQNNQSALTFIKSELIPYALNMDGVGPFNVYVDRDTGKFHFHTHTYNKDKIYRSYLVARNVVGTVISFTPDDDIADAVLLGHRETHFEVYDPAQKRFTTDLASLEKNAKKMKAQESKVTETDPMVPTYKVIASEADVKTYTAAFWCNVVARYSYGATLEIVGDWKIPVNQYVEIMVIMPSGRPHFTSGVYHIEEVTDRITTAGYVSTLKLFRYATKGGGGPSFKGIKQTLTPLPANNPLTYTVKVSD